MDNRRKMHTATMAGNNWPDEAYPNATRYANSKAYQQQEYDDERDVRYPEEKTSEETVVEIGEADANKNIDRDYPDESLYVKMFPKQSSNLIREKYQKFGDYADVPDAVTAMQKLQRLKELQLKRDISERYYSQEIKRLIGEYYFGPRYMSPSVKPPGKLQSSSFQPYTEDRLKSPSKKNLEPCGTMTTITRLDCGCIQETTRPIFTTARGRVQKKSCSQSQDEILLKLSSSNPQEHLSSLLERRNDNYRAKLKKRLPMEPRICPKIAPAGDQDFGTGDEKRNDQQEVEISKRIQRTTSPHRRISDTSVNSG